LAAHGGFHHIEFAGDKDPCVRRVTLSLESLSRLQGHMMLFFTGISRTASDIAARQIENIPHRQKELSTMYAMVAEAMQCLRVDDFRGFGHLLNESWQIKRTLSSEITTPLVDDIYARAMKAGAWGGKLLGAGGGGFILIFVEPEKKQIVREALKQLLEIPFRFESLGSQIIFYQPDSGVVA
ncbi:MAG: kinase, partial [Candidatus Omnitrophota bacterium]